MADPKQLFVEQRDEGDFAVRKGNSDRASAVAPTQKDWVDIYFSSLAFLK